MPATKSALLARALLDIPAIPRDDEDRRIADELLDDINAGRAVCVNLNRAGKAIGSLVYEIRGALFIVHALRCDNIPDDCTALAVNVARDLARRNGCKEILCDTKRGGLVAKLITLGASVNSVSLCLAV